MTTPSHAIIVGTGPRLGMAIARRFGSGGCRVSLISRQSARLAGFVEALASEGVDAQFATADVTDSTALGDALDKVQASWGVPSFVVFNASYPAVGRIAGVEPAQLAAALCTSALGAVSLLQAVLPAMARRGSGSVLMTGSAAALDPQPHEAIDSAAKAALRALTLAAARDYDRDGVHIALVSLGGEPTLGGNFDAARIADTYWDIAQEASGAWTYERVFAGQRR